MTSSRARFGYAVVLIGLAVMLSVGTAHAGILPVVQPYESFSDSPFSGQPFTWFYLEDFEDGFLNTPGVTASTGVVAGPGAEIDSVDGGGNNGHSFFSESGAAGITFTFNAAALGGHLPTAAGIVWTDGDPGSFGREFQAFDENNVQIGSTLFNLNDGWFFEGDGNPEHFIFFGVTNPGGISSIFIANGAGGIEVDHLQYGLNAATTPEPGSMMLLASGLLGLAGWRRKATK